MGPKKEQRPAVRHQPTPSASKVDVLANLTAADGVDSSAPAPVLADAVGGADVDEKSDTVGPDPEPVNLSIFDAPVTRSPVRKVLDIVSAKRSVSNTNSHPQIPDPSSARSDSVIPPAQVLNANVRKKPRKKKPVPWRIYTDPMRQTCRNPPNSCAGVSVIFRGDLDVSIGNVTPPIAMTILPFGSAIEVAYAYPEQEARPGQKRKRGQE